MISFAAKNNEKTPVGIIQRQSLKYTIVNLIGTFIGFMSVIFIYPREQELYGYFQFLWSTAMIMVPVLGLGINSVIIKYYPIFVQKQRQRHFLAFTLTFATISAITLTILLAVIFFVFEDYFKTLFFNFEFVEDNIGKILILSYLLLYASLFFQHAVARYKVVIPDMIYTLALKLFLPVLILSIYLGWFDRALFPVLILIYYLVVVLALLAYVLYLDKHSFQPKLNSINRIEYKAFGSFMAFSFLNGIGASLALRLDNAMIGSMMTINAVYIYGTILTISNVIEIPSKAINQISSAVISSSWANNDKANIQDIYQKSSVYGWIVGLFLFLLIYFIWVDILKLMPGKIELGLSLILIIFTLLSFSRIIDLVTGVNSVILSYSEHYKYHMYFLVIMAVMNIGLNYVFILKIGIVGAALATCISYCVFNLMKYVFLKVKLGFYIEWWPHFKILGVGIAVFGIMSLFQPSFNPFINIIVKSSITTALFSSLILFFNPGGEVQKIVYDYLNKIRPKK